MTDRNVFSLDKTAFKRSSAIWHEENAVYGQLYCALITYVLLKWIFQETMFRIKFVNITFIQFARKLLLGRLPGEVNVEITARSKRFVKFDGVYIMDDYG